MKRLIALMMALAIVLSFAACGGQETETEKKKPTQNDVGSSQGTTPDENTEDIGGEAPEDTENGEQEVTGGDAVYEELEIVDTTTALEILDYAWVGMGAENQPASYGGHISAEYMGGPNTYELAYAEDLAATLLLPEDQMDVVIDAATVVHMMNANSMTVGVLKLREGTDVKAFADATVQRISGNQWMCGFPEKLVVIQVHENFLLVGYGLAELIDPMVDGMGENWTVNELYNQIIE